MIAPHWISRWLPHDIHAWTRTEEHKIHWSRYSCKLSISINPVLSLQCRLATMGFQKTPSHTLVVHWQTDISPYLYFIFPPVALPNIFSTVFKHSLWSAFYKGYLLIFPNTASVTLFLPSFPVSLEPLHLTAFTIMIINKNWCFCTWDNHISAQSLQTHIVRCGCWLCRCTLIVHSTNSRPRPLSPILTL